MGLRGSRESVGRGRKVEKDQVCKNLRVNGEEAGQDGKLKC